MGFTELPTRSQGAAQQQHPEEVALYIQMWFDKPTSSSTQNPNSQHTSRSSAAAAALVSPRSPKMKIIAAYLLAVLGGNTAPSSAELKKILSSVGAEAEDNRIELLFSQIKDKDITELIASGREKLASVPSGGGGVAVAAPVSGGAAAPAAAETKKEEKDEEKEESDDDMGFSLFD